MTESVKGLMHMATFIDPQCRGSHFAEADLVEEEAVTLHQSEEGVDRRMKRPQHHLLKIKLWEALSALNLQPLSFPQGEGCSGTHNSQTGGSNPTHHKLNPMF